MLECSWHIVIVYPYTARNWIYEQILTQPLAADHPDNCNIRDNNNTTRYVRTTTAEQGELIETNIQLKYHQVAACVYR